MKCSQFEIWVADLNPSFGTESGKTRPVLIIQSNLLNRVHPSSLIVPITTNIKIGVNILRINLTKGVGGLKEDSAIMIDQIRAIDNKRLIRKVGALPKSLHLQVKENLMIVLDL